MKKIALFLLAALLFPAMLSAQNQVKAIHQEPVDLKVTIPGYNERIPAAVMNVNFLFDQETETLTVTMSKGNTKCNYDKIWLPKDNLTVNDMRSYMKQRGVRLKKMQTFTDQVNVLGLSSKPLFASIQPTGMTFNGVYDLRSSKRVKKQLDHQMVPLDGKKALVLTFKVNDKAKNVTLNLLNPIPMNRSWGKGKVAYVADDISIKIELGRCKDADELIATIQEYETLFEYAEEKLNTYKKNPGTLKGYKEFVLGEFNALDMTRFSEASCDEVQESYERLMDCIDRIQAMGGKTPNPNPNPDPKPKNECDVKALNDEVKTTTNKLNNLVNEYSMASTDAERSQKKAAFDSMIKSLDTKLNGLPAGCKGKLDSKILKNYEFVKKLIK